MEQGASAVDKDQTARLSLSGGRRVAAMATAVTLLLVALKGVVGSAAHSPALVADAVHSGGDALAIFASWVGLKLASRPPTKRFPFGLYRAETLACLLVAAIIAVTGVQLLVESVSALTTRKGVPHHSLAVLAVALASAAISFGLFVWEKRAGSRLNSQSLLANADESRADILTSLVVFLGTGATYLGVPTVEFVVSALVSVLIVWLGLKHGRLAVYALLDASLDPALERQAIEIARRVPGVMDVEQIRLRQAGPFCFGIAHIQLHKSVDLARGHEVAHQVVHAVKTEMPQIETLTVHIEPFHPEVRVVMVPVSEPNIDAAISGHFARARFFIFATVSSRGVESVEHTANPARTVPARAALATVKEALKDHHVDAVLTREIGQIAFHTLRDHYVEIFAAPSGSAKSALERLAQNDLPRVVHPTRVSEAAEAPPVIQPTETGDRGAVEGNQSDVE